MRVVVTGAGGFIGRALVRRLSSKPHLGPRAEAITELSLVDLSLPPHSDDETRTIHIQGDIADRDVRNEITAGPVDVLFHLAGLPGGMAEEQHARGWAVNVGATTALVEALSRQESPARLVFSSTIGVFGVPLPASAVNDDTLPVPTMSYGAQKLMMELLIADYTRRGLLEGVSLRLPGIVPRPRVKTGHISAFMSEVFHALSSGDTFECPVSPEATVWLMSIERCVDNLIHAAGITSTEIPGRGFCLPALRLSMGELVEALGQRFGDTAKQRVSWNPRPEVEAQYGAYPPIKADIADRLGFAHDGDADALIARAIGTAPRS